MGNAIRLGWLAALAACLPLTGCVYTAERYWVRESTPNHLGPRVPLQEIMEKRGPFFEALRACVIAHDPERLPELEAGRGYPTSGWFMESERHDAVLSCMRNQGWATMPATLLIP